LQLLYKQKFFNYAIPKVEQGFAAAKGTTSRLINSPDGF
jgi:hypothetical protein